MNRLQVYRFLCACLTPAAPESPTTWGLARRIAREPIDWGSIILLANQHLVAPAVGYGLRQKGLFCGLPTDVQAYLTAVCTLNAQRNRRLRDQLLTVGAELNAQGVEPLLLKGAAGLVTGLYPDDSFRIIGDLDVAVPASRLDDCIATLTSTGYRLCYAHDGYWLEHWHAPPLEHPEWAATVELHREIVSSAHRSLLGADEVWRAARPLHVHGVRWRLPSSEHRILHHIVHTQLQDGNYGRGYVQLRQLYDLLLLRNRNDDTVDWPLLLAAADRVGAGAALRAYLLVAQKLLGQPLPESTHVSLGAYAAYSRLLLQTYSPAVKWLIVRASRLRYLPLRLVTPSWYPAKYRALKKCWWRGVRGKFVRSTPRTFLCRKSETSRQAPNNR